MRSSGTGFDVKRCHNCLGCPESTTGQLKPPSPPRGLDWYFNMPSEQKMIGHVVPCAWCKPNRDPQFDPILVDIMEVYKCTFLEHQERRVRPTDWQSAFEVQAVMADHSGARLVVPINLFTFVMNPRWAAHSIVRYIDEWLPEHMEYVGKVLHPNVLAYSLPAPAPPYPGLLTLVDESTIVIEEVDENDEEERAASRQECEEAFVNIKRMRLN